MRSATKRPRKLSTALGTTGTTWKMESLTVFSRIDFVPVEVELQSKRCRQPSTVIIGEPNVVPNIFLI